MVSSRRKQNLYPIVCVIESLERFFKHILCLKAYLKRGHEVLQSQIDAFFCDWQLYVSANSRDNH